VGQGIDLLFIHCFIDLGLGCRLNIRTLVPNTISLGNLVVMILILEGNLGRG
jgi:hypothetical protein